MCGICGIVRTSHGPQLSESLVVRMRDSLVHRGPDGAGLHLDEYAGLGHRRLSIVDVAHGQQPMFSDDGRYVLVYNGEVFNHPVLQAQLEADGVRYKTRSDTETVLRLFERYGDAAVAHLRGMFAIALWDRSRRRLWLSRDRFGVKPLYYVHRSDGSLWFASEIKALLTAEAVKPALNVAQLPDYLANHAPSGDETLFEGVRRLPPGHTLVWENGSISISKYWDLSWKDASTDRDLSAVSQREYVEEYTRRFTEAVRIRLMADVPLGMFLSGGIDSAAITAVMSGLVQEPIKTFSVAFAEREANELTYARLVSTHFGTDHREVVVSPEEFWKALPSLVWHEDEPIAHPSSIALNFVSRLAAEHVKVVLTGEGSDETLAGYNRYRVTVYNAHYGRRYESIVPSGLRDGVRSAIQSLPASSRLRQKAERTFLTRGADLDDLYFDNFAVFGRSAQAALLSPSMREVLGKVDPYAAYHRALETTDAASLLDKLLYTDTKTYLHELLMKQDQMSMAASLESRVPFLDHPLVEWVARLPESMKLRGVTTKWILREAMRGRLPNEILDRKKMGFPVPIAPWLRGSWRFLLDEYVLGARAGARGLFSESEVQRMVAEHDAGVRNHAERLWSLINLEVWQRVFLDGEGREMPIATP
jgi:asparagine synthase (glutamine-hydrolysing)